MDRRLEQAEAKVSEVSSHEDAGAATRSLPLTQLDYNDPTLDEQSSTSPSRNRFTARELVTKFDFIVFTLVVGALSYGCYSYLTARYGNDEVRDRWFFLSIPVSAEIAYWCGRLIARVARDRHGAVGESWFSRSGVDMWLYIIPVTLVCSAFLTIAPLSYDGVVVVLALLFYQFLRDRMRALRWLELVEVPVSVYLFAQAFSVMVLKSFKDEHHWAFFLGPAQAVVEGGSLLWSVPSQYGFLNVLTIASLAKLLGVDPVDSMSILLIATQFVAAALTVGVFRFCLGFTTIGSTVLAVAVQLCLPGWIETYAGPAFAPSTSAMRFLPAASALLSIDQAVRRSSTMWSCFAAVLIAISCLWSPESCLYTAAPLLGYLTLSFLRAPSLALLTGVAVRTCAIAAALVGMFLGMYALSLPQGIDFTSFYEFAQAYSDYFVVLPIELNGWSCFFVFLLSFSYFIARNQFAQGGKDACQGVLLFGYIMCIGTYFVARSAYRNTHNITPWVLLCVAALVVRGNASERKAQRAMVFVVSSLVVITVLSLYSGDNKNKYLERSSSAAFYVPPKFSQLPAHIAAAARKVTNSDRFTFVHDRAMFARTPEIQTLGNALPINPLMHFTTPRAERVRLYTQRMLEYAPESFVLCEARVCPGVPYAFREMTDLIEVTEVPFEFSDTWKVYRLSRKQPNTAR